MSDTFQNWMILEINDVLRQPGAPLLLWCDPELAWLELLQRAAEVGFFELWAPTTLADAPHELELRDRMYRSAPAPRVVWVPTARDELTWFKTYELEAEEVWEKSLLEALRQYGVDISYDHELELVGLLPAHAKEWFDKPKHTWKELTPGNAKGALVDDHRMLQVLAGQDGEFHTLREENRFDIFARRAVEDFGLPNPAKLEERNWRVESLAYLLCTEASYAVPSNIPSEPDRIIANGLPRTRALDLLKRWQSHIQYIPSFETLVPKADAIVGLTYWARNLSKPPRSYSSKAVEDALFAEAVTKFDRIEDVESLAKELADSIQSFKDRERGFWASQARIKTAWRFLIELGDVASLLIESDKIEQNWNSIADALEWYSTSGWKLDWAGEQLFKERTDLNQNLDRIRARLRRGYLRTMDRIGRAFSALLAADQDQLANQPSAGELVLAEIENQTIPTAIFFLDACRYDIGYRLRELINEGEPEPRAHIAPAVSPLPSITALGMAFALPISKKKLQVSLSDDNKTFVVTADDFEGDLKWAKERRKWLKDKVGCKDWLEMSEIFSDPEALKKPSKTRRMIAIHGDELDDHDGELELTGTDEHLARYVQAVRRVRDAGYSRIIITTDHGFFHWQPDEHDVDERKPEGDIRWRHRRATVGYELSHPTAIKCTVSQSDLELLLPRSTNAFKTYGRLGFFHGGATLQEMVIPVVVANWPVKTRKADVVLKPVGYISSETPRIQIQAASTGQLLFFGPDSNLIPRSVVVKIVHAETGKLIFRLSTPVVVTPEGEPITIQMELIDPRPNVDYGTKLVVQILDADDEEPLGREEVQLKTEISDW